MKSQTQRGSAHVVIIVILVVALVGALGWIFWQNFMQQKPVAQKDDSTISKEEQKNTPTSKEYEPQIPEGWKMYENKGIGLSYAYPANIKTSFETYKTDEMIHVGFGAPVYVIYSTSDKAWKTYENDENNTPTILATTNLVKSAEVDAEEKYATSYYNTGDGTGGATRVLVLMKGTVYQFDLGKIADTDTITKFVKTISFTE